MPFVNGKFYMNPVYGRAVGRARLQLASAKVSKPKTIAATDPQQTTGDDHWVTINHRHVLIHEALPSSGLASIYSDRFDGRKTSNGEVFRQNRYTAALLPRSRWNAVPLGTKVEITSNGHSVVVEVNDRGAGDDDPTSTRALDLSHATAAALTGRSIRNDRDAEGIGLIRLDHIRVVSRNTPLGPVRR